MLQVILKLKIATWNKPFISNNYKSRLVAYFKLQLHQTPDNQLIEINGLIH